MAIFKCKMCGGQLSITDDIKIIECDYCGSTQTLPSFDNEKKTNLFNRANNLRLNNEFDKAAGVYETIVAEFPEEAEAYWGLCLCKYGIEYIDDPQTGNKIPTCHRTCTISIMDDSNFESTCENADVVSKKVYREEAKAIDSIQKRILEVVAKEEPYDVFICYKETDDVTHLRTEDSSIAQDIYTELVKEGYKVFFSRVTLRDKAGIEYEPYIYAALSSAKVMLVIGTKFEYYDAVWVKNEWSRFLDMMNHDAGKYLIPCYKYIDAYDIPRDFRNLQALNVDDITFFKHLLNNIERLIPHELLQDQTKQSAQLQTNAGTSSSLLKRAFMFLEDGEWTSANEYAEKVLDTEPECAEAYLVKLMSELQVKKKNMLSNCEKPFDDTKLYKKIIRFASTELKNELSHYLEDIHEKIKQASYTKAKKLFSNAKKASDYQSVYYMFIELDGYRDSGIFAEKCSAIMKEMDEEKQRTELLERNECSYYQACEAVRLASNISDLVWALHEFEALSDYKDSKNKADECKQKIDYESERIYDKAIQRAGSESVIIDLRAAISLLETIVDYRDSKQRIIRYDAKAKELSDEALEMFKRKQNGVCQYCGGHFVGLFKNKCSQCGKKKDY